MNSFRAFLYRVREKGPEKYPVNVVIFAGSVLENPKSPGKDAGEREWKQWMGGSDGGGWSLFWESWHTYLAESPRV